jgi:peptide/nickel transport system permease protein
VQTGDGSSDSPLFPGIAIYLGVLAYNLIGEGVQEAIDPRLRDAGR